TERAVDADDERARMFDREPEGVDGLAREVAPAAVDRGEGDPERQLGRFVEGGGDGRLRVEGVEDRLDQQKVDPTLGERPDLLGVGVADLVERVRAEGRIVDPGRERERDIEWPDRAGDEPADLVGRLARK